MNKIIILGAGASGYFAAIHAKIFNPNAEVSIIERGNKVLQKVLISGGGRCNVTHHQLDNNLLALSYPRGSKELKQAFSQFSVSDTIQFFESRGINLKIEQDGRMFPNTDDSQTIADCLVNSAESLGIKLLLSTKINEIREGEGNLILTTQLGTEYSAKSIVIATGGVLSESSLDFLSRFKINVIPSYPSIFTFFIRDKDLTELSGLSFNATLRLDGLKLESTGPVLITHWGLSGPSVLKLSAFGAKILYDKDYKYKLIIHLLDETNPEKIKEKFLKLKVMNGKKMMANTNPYDFIPKRLWDYILIKLEINPDTIFNELSLKKLNALATFLSRWELMIDGKGKFKEEFVQGGGVDLKQIDFKTMKCKAYTNISFAGEVLDIDGITGGFNFQAAWTTGYIAGKNALGITNQ